VVRGGVEVRASRKRAGAYLFCAVLGLVGGDRGAGDLV